MGNVECGTLSAECVRVGDYELWTVDCALETVNRERSAAPSAVRAKLVQREARDWPLSEREPWPLLSFGHDYWAGRLRSARSALRTVLHRLTAWRATPMWADSPGYRTCIA